MRKLKKIDKIIIVATVLLGAFILLLTYAGKRAERHYYFEEGFSGWVKVKHSYPLAMPLEKKDDILQIFVSDSGYVETSTFLKMGWGKDRFFRKNGNEWEEIPQYIRDEAGTRMNIHALSSYQKSFAHLLNSLKPGTDTTFYEGTKVKVSSPGRVSYTPGRKTLFYFYLSEKPEEIAFEPPKWEDEERLANTEDRMLTYPE